MTAQAPDPRSGIQPDGSFVPVFKGQREPFALRNAVSARHYLFSNLQRDEDRREVEAVAEWLRSLVPEEHPSFDPAVELAAGMLVRWARANAYILEKGIENVSSAAWRGSSPSSAMESHTRNGMGGP